MLGFLIGVAGGVVVGVLLGQVRFLSEVLSPYIKAVNALPRIVLGALFVIILGLGMSSKIVLAAFLVFFVVFFNAFQGVREVDGNLVNNARILGASRLQVIRNVVIPSAMTWIIASLHVAFGFAVIGAIVGEVLGAQHGLGVLITDSAEQLQRRRHLRRDDHHRRDRAGRRVADQPAGAAAAGLAAAGVDRGLRDLSGSVTGPRSSSLLDFRSSSSPATKRSNTMRRIGIRRGSLAAAGGGVRERARRGGLLVGQQRYVRVDHWRRRPARAPACPPSR